MASPLSETQWESVKELGSQGMRGAAIVKSLGLDVHISTINRYLQKNGIGQTGEPGELTVAEARREQMEGLFRGYQEVPPIKINGLKEGARVVIASDFQIPFEEPWLVGGTRKKFGAFEHFLSDYDPDLVAYNGDIKDCYAISTFDKSPSRRFGEREENKLAINLVETTNKAAPRAEKVWIDGNHEYRLWKTLMQICQKDVRAMELFGAKGFEDFNTKSFLHLDDFGWLWQPYQGWVDILGFIVTHGDIVSQESGDTARKMQKKWHSSGASGHTHRLGAYFHTDASGKAHAWYEIGCMCRMDLEYVLNPDWQQGFLIGEVNGGLLHTQLVPIFDNRFLVPGVGLYKGKV